MGQLKVLTWHVHGNYLWYLSEVPVTWYLPVHPGRPGYSGRGDTFPFGRNVIDVPASAVRDLDIDIVVHQSASTWRHDRFELLSPRQLELPAIVVEHDPPLGHPTDTVHYVTDHSATVVHVTAYNRLMWDNGDAPTTLIEYGVRVPPRLIQPLDIPRGVAVVNHMERRGRQLGCDLVET